MPADHAPRLDDRFFIVLGAQKSATTWLYTLLRAHHDVWLPPLKELHHFDAIWDDWGQVRQRPMQLRKYLEHLQVPPSVEELQWMARMTLSGEISDADYVDLLSPGFESKAYGDITPTYSSLPAEGFDHMKRLAPDAKVLFFLREPVSRLWSALRMSARTNADASEMEAASAMRSIIEESLIWRLTDYGHTIRQMRRCYPEARCLFGFFDDVQATPAREAERVVDFLGVSRAGLSRQHVETSWNPGRSAEIPPALESWLIEKTRPIVEETRELLGSVPEGWDRPQR